MSMERASATTREPFATGFRLTAADRPGVAQPVPERDIPAQPWRPIALAATLMFLAMVGTWEWHWRDFGVTPSYRNSNGQWAQQRRRINAGEGNKIVLIGSSRMLFDVQLPVWERMTGERPIQLAMEGTSAMPTLEDLAGDPDFTGRLLIDITPLGFFAAESTRADIVPYYHKQSPSERIGNWLSMTFLEPYLAFDDPISRSRPSCEGKAGPSGRERRCARCRASSSITTSTAIRGCGARSRPILPITRWCGNDGRRPSAIRCRPR